MMAAPMFRVSGPDLVIAASRAGVVGAFPISNTRTIEILSDWMARLSAELGTLNTADYRPWGLAITVHRTNTRLAEELALVVRHQVPIVISALGSPRRIVEQVHSYGGLVFADVNTVEYARKAADCEVDGLALVASGAGGHTGMLSPFAFVSAVRAFWDGLIMLGGGICNGRALAAAQLLGVDLVAMGTRFIPSEESLAEPEYKQMLVDSTAADLVVSKAFTGANASMLRQTILREGLDPDDLADRKSMDFRGHNSSIKPWKGIWSAGQGIGEIQAIEPAARIVDRIEREYRTALENPAEANAAAAPSDRAGRRPS